MVRLQRTKMNNAQVATMGLIFLLASVCLQSCGPTDSVVTATPPSILTEMPMLTPMPEFLIRVFPRPNSTLTVKEYNDRLKIPAGAFVHEVGIGVELNSIAVAEVNDDLYEQDIIKRVSLLVDSEVVTTDVPFDWASEPEYTKATDEHGQLLYQVRGGNYWMLWREPLEIGAHKATFRITRTSGEILEYNWSFEILP